MPDERPARLLTLIHGCGFAVNSTDLEDAIRQVLQIAITAHDNCEHLKADLAEQQQRIAALEASLHNSAMQSDRYLEQLKTLSDELAEERALLDGAAEIRIVDGIDGIDIDNATAEAFGLDCDEEAWKQEWRKQFRIALRAAIDAARRKP